MTLLLEIAERHGWRRVGELHPGDPPGSLSHNTEHGREIVKFTCHDDHSVIERSLGGADTESGPARIIATTGFETIACLQPGQRLDLWLRTDRMTRPARFRFRQRASGV
jgi:hypothetical protein